MSPPLAVTEDTPADMLAGSMDLDIVLPSGHVVRTSVLRSTPMMDLLVQVTTAHRLSPGSHSLQAMGDRGALPYKPSTPIGALDTFSVRIVQKKSFSLKKAPQIPQVLPTTFRLQVHLPRSQLFVTRVNPQVTVGDILQQVCREKNLDALKYELRNTGNMNQSLVSTQNLGELETQELTLVVRGAAPVRQMSSADIMHVKQANRQNGACDSSLSSGSLESRSISPVVMPAPQPPQRKKRRPAPKPPETQTRSVVISHSRESSDSSGYHEPSTLSESPTHGGPPSDISNAATRGSRGLSNMAARNSHSLSNLTSLPASRLPSSASVTSLSSNGPSKKKRAPPPPPLSLPAENGTDVRMKSATLPADTRRKSEMTTAPPPPPVELAPSPPTSPEVASPEPQPRFIKTPKLDEEPTVVPRKHLYREPAFDEQDEVFETNGTIEFSDTYLEPPKPTPRSLGPKPPLVEKPKHLRGSQSSSALLAERNAPILQKTQSAGNVLLGSKLRDDFSFHSISRWGNESQINVFDNEIKKSKEYKKEDLLKADSTDESEYEKDNSESSPRTPDDFPKRIQDTSTVDVKSENFERNFGSHGSGSDESDNDVGDVEDIDDDDVTPKASVEPSEQFLFSQEHQGDIQHQTSIEMSLSPDDKIENQGRRFNATSLNRLDVPLKLIEDTDDINSSGDEDCRIYPSEPPPSLEGPATDVYSQPSSLSEDWEYQLPLPPSHFRDTTPPRSPSPTDGATLGTKDTVITLENPLIESVDRSLHPLNGIYEDVETENSKTVKDVGLDETDRVINKNVVKEAEKVLVHKTDVMNELTNVIERRRLQEKSQSFNNLYLPSLGLDSKKKSNTLSYSQSFLNRPISNFTISNYEDRSVEEDKFKKPAVPPTRANSVRRADSMNTKKMSLEVIEQEFLQYLHEKQLDPGLKIGDLAAFTAMLPPRVEAKETKVEKQSETVVPVIVKEVKKAISLEDEAPVVVQPVDTTKKIDSQAQSTLAVLPPSKISVVPQVNGTSLKSLEQFNSFSEETKVVIKIAPEVVKKEVKSPARRPVFQPPSISMGTWGERPKSKVVIKDEDYTTEVNLSERRPDPPELKPRIQAFEPKATPEKKTVNAIKKPNYEQFSALKRRSFEDIEEQPLPPVIRAAKLKKEFRIEPDLIQGLKTEKKIIEIDGSLPKPELPKTTSLSMNGSMKPPSWNTDAQNGTKARFGPMPIVKGFRANYSHVNIVPGKKPEMVQKQISLPEPGNKGCRPIRKQESLPAEIPATVNQGIIPPPPPIGSFTHRRVAQPPIINDDPRGKLLEQIRSFTSDKLRKKTVQ